MTMAGYIPFLFLKNYGIITTEEYVMRLNSLLSRLFLICGFCFFSSLFISCGKKVPSITTKLVTDGPTITDHSYNEKAWNGVLSFYHDEWGDEKYFGTLYDVVACQGVAQAFSNLKRISGTGTDLIILTSFSLSEPLASVAAVFPDQKYMIVDGFGGDLPNVLNIAFASEEGSFLVGAAAALQAKAEGISNPSFGFIGGIPSLMLNDFEVGYVQGIRAIYPDAIIYDHYVNHWADPKAAAAKAKVWYDGEVYAVYSAAGGSGNGTIAQAVAHRKNGKNVWAIGVDSDQVNEGSYGAGKSAVLTSMIKNVDQAVLYGLNKVKNNTFSNGYETLGLKNTWAAAASFRNEANSIFPLIISLLYTSSFFLTSVFKSGFERA